MKAFPLTDEQYRYAPDEANGMDLRDYFAGFAMQKFLTDGWLDKFTELDLSVPDMESTVAKMSYGMADAMIREREDAK